MAQTLQSSWFPLKATGQFHWRCPLQSVAGASGSSSKRASEERVLRNDRAASRRERTGRSSPLQERESQVIDVCDLTAEPAKERAVPPSMMMFRFERQQAPVYARQHINSLHESLSPSNSHQIISSFIKDVSEPKFSVLPLSHSTSPDASPNASSPSSSPGVQRIKWTPEMHERFVCAVESIGIEKGLCSSSSSSVVAVCWRF